MNCREAGNALSPYLENELDARRREEFVRHAAGCARCAAELATLRRAVEVLAAPKAMAQPEGLLAEFKQRLAAETPLPQRTWWNTPWSWSLAGLTATAAAAALIVSLHGTATAPPHSAKIQQIAERPNDLAFRAETPMAAVTADADRAAPGAPAPEVDTVPGAGGGSRSDAYAPARAPAKPAPPLPAPHAAVPQPSSGPAPVAPGTVSQGTLEPLDGAPAAASHERGPLTRTEPFRQTPSPLAAKKPPALGRMAGGQVLAEKGHLAGLAPPPHDPQKAEVRLREPETFAAGAPALAGAAPPAAAPEGVSRPSTGDAPSARRGESPTSKVAATAARRDRAASSPAPPAGEGRMAVTVHRPYPEAQDWKTGAGLELGGGFAGAARGGAGAGGAPAGPAGPTGAPGTAAGIGAAAPAVAPELAAAMRVPVDVKVSNVTLLGLTDRLSAEAEVSIVVDDPIVRQLRVSAELTGVPLYRALESVATQANLVIEPRPGGITLQLRDAAPTAPGDREKRIVAPAVWSPAWGTLPRTGFAVSLARSSDAAGRGRQVVGGRTANATNARANANAGGNASNKEAAPAQRRILAADESLALQNQQTLQKAANQLGALNAPPVLLACPHCRRPLSQAATYVCPKCKRPVKATDLKCSHCGQATPARCPHCRQALMAPPLGPAAR